jgi:hypothetical protein
MFKMDRFAGESPAQRKRHAEIALRYSARTDRPGPSPLVFIRLKDLHRLLTERWGKLPDDDAGHEDAKIVANHIAAIVNFAARDRYLRKWQTIMPPGFDLAAMVARAHSPQKYSAARLGQLMRLTSHERLQYGIQTIRAHDALSDAAVKAGRRQRDKSRKARQRAAARASKPPPVSVSRPWEALGISRRTWYRRRKTGDDS